jgi:hypothetical protein
MDTNTEVPVLSQMNRTRDAHVFAAILPYGGSQCIVSRAILERAGALLAVRLALRFSLCMWHCPGATRPRKRAVALPRAFGLPARVAGWTWRATSTASAAAASTSTKTIHSPAHRRLRQALRRQRRTDRPLFTRPAWPRRALRSHNHQRAPCKLSVHTVDLCSPCAHHSPTRLPRGYAR